LGPGYHSEKNAAAAEVALHSKIHFDMLSHMDGIEIHPRIQKSDNFVSAFDVLTIATAPGRSKLAKGRKIT